MPNYEELAKGINQPFGGVGQMQPAPGADPGFKPTLDPVLLLNAAKAVGEYFKNQITQPIQGTMDAARMGQYNVAPGQGVAPNPMNPLGATMMGIGAGWKGRATGPNELGQINAFHGSPYKFDKFKSEKIGTGEGAQAFGHGLYFTSEKDIAKHYQQPNIDKLRQKYSNAWTGVELYLKGDKKAAIDHVDYMINGELERIKRFGASPDSKHEIEKLNRVKDDLVNDRIEKGQTYSVTLHKGKQPSEYDYLKWDELVPHSKKLQLTEQIKDPDLRKRLLETRITGQGLYDELVEYFAVKSGELIKEGPGTGFYDSKVGAKEASAFLLRAGIDGIEYPAGSLSGGVKKGAKNWVVFDENAITIEGK